MRRSREELMESLDVQVYVDFVRDGYLNVDEELEKVEINWLETTNEYVVNSDLIIMDGLTERESEDLCDALIGVLQEIKEERIG